MRNRDFLSALCAQGGASGWEEQAARLVADQFRRKSDDVWTDGFYNTFARMGAGPRPRVLVAAHVDQIALMVKVIHDDGFLGFTRVGGVDRRILPGKEVTVHGIESLPGIIGSRPPHVQEGEDKSKSIPMEDLAIDIGFSAEEARKRVRVGDIVTFLSPVTDLADGTITGAALDDRAGVVALCEAMDRLQGIRLYPEVVFAATTQEEVGSIGAATAAFGGEYDMAIVLDVTHGETPDAPKFRTFPMDKVSTQVGPYISRPMLKRLRDVAKKEHIELTDDISGFDTGTDADSINIVEAGIPLCVIQFPLRYMHTPVELMRYALVEEAGRLLAAFLRSIDDGWEEWLCC